MKPASLFRVALSVTLAWLLAIPLDGLAQAAPHAGQVSRVVPMVHLERGQQQLPAAARTPVYWNDVVATEAMGRARVSLDDGSILNVGSNSSLHVARHDAGAQQSEMDLNYGRLRARAVKLVKPHSNFDIRTSIGTAGVVGTDFFLAFENNILRLIVFEGIVRFCNLAGVCVSVLAGTMSTIRGDQPPDQPVQTPQADLLEAISTTDVQGPENDSARKPRGHHSPWFYVATLGIAAPAFVLPSLGNKKLTCTTVGGGQVTAGPPIPAQVVCH
jgi:hypothetical protein